MRKLFVCPLQFLHNYESEFGGFVLSISFEMHAHNHLLMLNSTRQTKNYSGIFTNKLS